MKKEKAIPVIKGDFTLTRNASTFWLSFMKGGEEGYVLEVNMYEALELAEFYEVVIRTDNTEELEHDPEEAL